MLVLLSPILNFFQSLLVMDVCACTPVQYSQDAPIEFL